MSSRVVVAARSSALISDRDGLYFDQGVVTEEPAHLNERARRRLGRVDIFVADRTDGRDLADISEEVVELDDVAPRGIGGLECARQVLEDLSRLSLEVPLADQLAVAIERDLP